MLAVTVHSEVAEQPDETRLAELIGATVRETGGTLGQVSVSFVDPDTSQRLNREHRNIDKPTDVLSWPFDGSFPNGAGGELILCPEIARQAVTVDHSLERELDLLTIHGALHLLGLEDATEPGRQKMEQLTDRILQGVTHG